MIRNSLCYLMFISIFLCFALNMQAQSGTDIVTLKSGEVKRGVIIEQDVKSHINLKLENGQVIIIKNDEIEKISKDGDAVKQYDQFKIKDVVLKSTFHGIEIGSMRWKKLKGILRNVNDQEINKDLSKLQTKRVLNTTFSVIGCTLLGIGAAGILLVPEDQSSTGILAAGLGFFIGGSIAGSGSRALIKKMMIRFNEVIEPKVSMTTIQQ